MSDDTADSDFHPVPDPLAAPASSSESGEGFHPIPDPLAAPSGTDTPPAGYVPIPDPLGGDDPTGAARTAIGAPSSPAPTTPEPPLTLGKGAALFGSGAAEGAGSLPLGVASGVEAAERLNARLQQDAGLPVIGSPQIEHLAGRFKNWLQGELGRLPKPQGGAQSAIYNAGEGVGRVLPFAVAPETLPGALLSSEAGEGARTAVGAAGGSPTEQNVADIVGGFGTSVPSLASAAVRGLARGASGLATQQSIQDFDTLGMPLSVGTATGNRALLGLERTVAAMPGGARRMDRLYANQGAGASGAVDNIINNLSGGTLATPTAGGEAVEQGVNGTIGNLRTQAKGAYAAVDKLVPHDAPIDVTGTSQLLGQITTPMQGAEASTGSLIAPKLKALADNLAADTAQNGGALPYAAARHLKSALGEQIDWSPFPTDPANGALKRVYGQLGADIDAGASGISPQAAQAVRSANAQYAASMDQVHGLSRIVGKNGGPEAVFNAALSGSGQQGGATIINRVMDALDPDQKNIFAASVLRRMATPSPGSPTTEFSPAQFLTQWNKMNPEARQAIFGQLPNGYSQSLTTLTKNLSKLKAANSVLMNPSGTAAKAMHTAFFADLLGSVPVMLAEPRTGLAMMGTAAAGWGGANLAARVLTNPNAVKWLAQATSAPTGRLLGSAAAVLQSQIQKGEGASRKAPTAISLQEQKGEPATTSPDGTPPSDRGGSGSRATGGKVDHEVLVSRLMDRWHAARKSANKTTEPLLNFSDATIEKALRIAAEARL